MKSPHLRLPFWIRVPATTANLGPGFDALGLALDLYTILNNFGVITAAQAAAWKPALSYAWLYPSTCFLTLACGILLSRKTQAR